MISVLLFCAISMLADYKTMLVDLDICTPKK